MEFAKLTWHKYAQFAIWIMAISSSFIVSPPVVEYSATSGVRTITPFLIAALLSLISIPIHKKSKFVHHVFWNILAWVFFIFLLISLFLYNQIIKKFTVSYYETTVVIGDKMDDSSQIVFDSLNTQDVITIQEFVMGRADKNASIWIPTQLSNRFLILSGTYIFVVLLSSGFLISILQALFCYSVNTHIKEEEL